MTDVTATFWQTQGFDRGEDEPVAVVAAAGGIYGTAPTCYLSLVARARGLRRADLDRALYETRDLVRVRAMRASLYMIPRPLLPTVAAATRSLGVRGFVATLRRAGGGRPMGRSGGGSPRGR